jgi:hypothetical protein
MIVIFFLSLENSILYNILYFIVFPNIFILIESDVLVKNLYPTSDAASNKVISSGDDP